jgi:hypothetical protein
VKLGRILPWALVAVWSAQALGENVGFEWPDSRNYWRALVNVNQYIQRYMRGHPDWFAKDKLITDFAVYEIKPGEQKRAVEQYHSVRGFLEARGMVVGTYTSGTTVSPASAQHEYPHRKVTTEEMPQLAKYVGSWPGHEEIRIIDVSDAQTRHALQKGITILWQQTPAPLRFVDNAGIHQSAGRAQPWQDYCTNIRELRQIGEFLHSRVMFNLSLHVGMLSDKEATQLIEAVGRGGGIALEMPWSRSIRTNPTDSSSAERRYRQLLDNGIAIVMIAVDTPEVELTAWVRSWRRPADHLYIADSFWKAPRDYHNLR